MQIEPRISIVTLGVSGVKKARRFYEKGLGWKVSTAGRGDIVFFQLGGMALALYPRDLLAEDAAVEATGAGFRGITLAYKLEIVVEISNLKPHSRHTAGVIFSLIFCDLSERLMCSRLNKMTATTEAGR